jgi:hypothetical protein
MMKQQLESNVRRKREISELTIALEGLEQKIAKSRYRSVRVTAATAFHQTRSSPFKAN